MDGKARLGVRNWDFSGQQPPSRGVDPSLKQPSPDGGAPSHQQAAAAAAAAVSAQHAAFLKMSAYPEPNYPGMDFGWVPQRNFLAAAPPKSDLNSTPAPAPPPMPPAAAVAAKPAKKTKKSSRVATKILHPKAPKKPPPPRKEKKGASGVSAGKREKKNTQEMVAAVEGISFDFSGVPAPVCSCTGVSRQCYRWGGAGWQSACCTTTISEYPLPMSSSRPGARLAGRKMSINAYSKLLQRLAVEGYDLSNPVDLKAHWARHGTNKFVTIR